MVTTSLRAGVNTLRYERVGALPYSLSSVVGTETIYSKRYGTLVWDYGQQGKIYDIDNKGYLNVIDVRGGICVTMDISMPTSSGNGSHGVYIKTSSEEFIMYHRYSSNWYKIYTDWDISYATIANSPTSSQYGAGSVFLGTVLNTAGDDDSVYTYLREESKIYKYSVSSNSWSTINYSTDPNMSGMINVFWSGAIGWNWKGDGNYIYLIVRNSSKVPYLAKYNLTTNSWETVQKIHGMPYYSTYSSTYKISCAFDGNRTFFGLHSPQSTSSEETDKYQSRVLFMIQETDDGVFYHPIGKAPIGYRYFSTSAYFSQWLTFVEVDGAGYMYFHTGVSEPDDPNSIFLYRAFVEHLR